MCNPLRQRAPIQQVGHHLVVRSASRRQPPGAQIAARPRIYPCIVYEKADLRWSHESYHVRLPNERVFVRFKDLDEDQPAPS